MHALLRSPLDPHGAVSMHAGTAKAGRQLLGTAPGRGQGTFGHKHSVEKAHSLDSSCLGFLNSLQFPNTGVAEHTAHSTQVSAHMVGWASQGFTASTLLPHAATAGHGNVPLSLLTVHPSTRLTDSHCLPVRLVLEGRGYLHAEGESPSCS